MTLRTAAIFAAGCLLLAVPVGCTGNYILTVPDQVAPAGGEAVTVVRLQRSEIALLALPVEIAVIRFRADDGQERAAYTDSLGYAGTTVPVPMKKGTHVLHVTHLDREGDEIYQTVPLYVWDPNRPAVAVDLDSLPPAWLKEAAAAARQGLQRLAEERNVCYLTRRPVEVHAAAHRDLAAGGYPDGPVLLWQQERWHILREGMWKVRVVVESKLVSQLPFLRKTFPGLQTGLTDSAASAKAFAEAGMRVLMVGGAAGSGPNDVRYADWGDLARRGL